MVTKYVLAGILSAGLFFSCGNPASGGKGEDSLSDTAKNKHGITVSDQSEDGPHQVKDTCYDCEHVERYDNGVIYMRGDVRAGLRHGTWLTFYKNGRPWSQGNYLEGYREGYGVAWHPNGQKSQEGYYKKDKMVGKWKFWDEYGTYAEKDFGGDTTSILK